MSRIPIYIHAWIEPEGEQFLYPRQNIVDGQNHVAQEWQSSSGYNMIDELMDLQKAWDQQSNNPLWKVSQVTQIEKNCFRYMNSQHKPREALWIIEAAGKEARGRSVNHVKVAIFPYYVKEHGRQKIFDGLEHTFQENRTRESLFIPIELREEIEEIIIPQPTLMPSPSATPNQPQQMSHANHPARLFLFSAILLGIILGIWYWQTSEIDNPTIDPDPTSSTPTSTNPENPPDNPTNNPPNTTQIHTPTPEEIAKQEAEKKRAEEEAKKIKAKLEEFQKWLDKGYLTYKEAEEIRNYVRQLASPYQEDANELNTKADNAMKEYENAQDGWIKTYSDFTIARDACKAAYQNYVAKIKEHIEHRNKEYGPKNTKTYAMKVLIKNEMEEINDLSAKVEALAKQMNKDFQELANKVEERLIQEQTSRDIQKFRQDIQNWQTRKERMRVSFEDDFESFDKSGGTDGYQIEYMEEYDKKKLPTSLLKLQYQYKNEFSEPIHYYFPQLLFVVLKDEDSIFSTVTSQSKTVKIEFPWNQSITITATFSDPK